MANCYLFDDIERSDLRSRFNAEPHFAYLNASGRRSTSRVRALVDTWYENMPKDVKKDLRNRFRSSDDIVHLGAFTELYCATLLKRHALGVQAHTLSPKGKKLDFLATKDARPAFVLECVTAGDSDVEVWENKLIRNFYDAVNRLQHADFFVIAQFIQAGNRPPSGRRARDFLQPLLASVDWQSLWTALSSGNEGSIPQWVWQYDGWQIHFRPIPKAPELRGIADINMVGIQMDRVRLSQPGKAWLDPLLRKASRYGKLDLPYVIAINGVGMFHRNQNIVDALFGQHAVNIDLRTGRATPTRHPNGLWVGPKGPRYRRVSAVLFLEHLTPWSVAKCNPGLWHNPWANKRLEDDSWLITQHILDAAANKITERKGRMGADLFGLELSWPGDD